MLFWADGLRKKCYQTSALEDANLPQTLIEI